MEYQEFLKSKQKTIIESGFDISEDELNPMLFDFQKFTIKRALRAGKYAVFADTGQGKTPMQLEIADQVIPYLKKNTYVQILAPLAVTGQTIKEGEKFNILVGRNDDDTIIKISNYEQINNIDFDKIGCIIIDESSILKNETGKFRNLLIEKCKNIPYKFCFSASPSPNDPTELGNHAEFLDIMTFDEMLAMYFVNDSKKQKQGSKWRLKGHAIDRFYEFVSTWAIMYSHPKDIGFPNSNFDLPELEIIEKNVQTPLPDGVLFAGEAVSATDYHQSLRETQDERISQTTEIIKSIDKKEPIIVWTKQNPESDKIYKHLISLGYDCRNVQGSDSPEKKEKDLLGFANKEFQILITKESIASMGLNYQHCGYQIFNSIDFSFERTYQALRRSWRFGRKEKVTAYMVSTDRMINVSKTQKEKQNNFQTMQKQMAKAVNKNLNNELLVTNYDDHDIKTDDYWLMRGDCVQRIKEVKDNSVDVMIFSPPFADLYVYSNKVEDMGNVSDYDQFKNQFSFLVKELKRIIKPGRLICVHSMNLPTLKSRDGYIGLRRFNSMIGDLFEKEDMFLHSEHAIWKDPLLAAVRTKTKGLAHQQLLKDSAQVRTGIFDTIQCFKTKEENETPIDHDLLRSYIPMHEYDQFPRTPQGFNEFYGFDSESKYDRETQYSHHVWQRYASPIWMDINASDTLQWTTARGKNDEKHICPLQLPVIERLLTLYSKAGETLLSPFGGIGSEGYQALKMGRKSISIELKESYFEVNKRNHSTAIEQNSQLQLF